MSIARTTDVERPTLYAGQAAENPPDSRSHGLVSKHVDSRPLA